MAFRRRYNLPPTDPRFLNATREDIITDYWAHFYAENGFREEIEDEDFDQDAILKEFADDSDDWEQVDLNG